MSFVDLPLIADLLKPDICKSSQHDPLCTCKGVLKKKSKPPVTDKRLKHWQQWMLKRKEMHQRLGQLLKRDSGGLLMNSAEELRTVKEEKLALEYTKIPQPDPQRGCPGFWKFPIELTDKCGKQTSCFATLTNEEKCQIPLIEHVGLAKDILEEKDVLPRSRNSHALWKESSYVQEKALELQHKMELVVPYKPNFDHLSIKGVSLNRSMEYKQLELPLPVKKDETNSEEITVKHATKPIVISLKVNNFEFTPNLNISGTRKVYVHFDYDINTNKLATENITIINKGTTVIRFYWKASEKVELFKDIIPEKRHEIHFYFNKNEDLILPGKTITFPIWFRTKISGIYCEYWELCTKPRVLPENARILIIIHASAVVGNLDEKMHIIEERLENNVRDCLIKEAISRVISNIPYKKFKPIIYTYNKREVFEAVNSKFNPVHYKSRYLYNIDVVRELQKFYKKVRTHSDPRTWNYRIDELKLLARAKERTEEHMKIYNEQQNDQVIQESPKPEGLDFKKTDFPDFDLEDVEQTVVQETQDLEKYFGQKVIENQNKVKIHSGNSNVEEKDNEELPITKQLEIILSKLEYTAAESNAEQTKHMQAYLILCMCFNKVSHEFEDLKERLGIIKKTKYPKFPVNHEPLHQKPTRLVWETPSDVLQGPSLMSEDGNNLEEPVPACLQEIPSDDCTRRYRTYYNIPDTPPQTAKGSKKGKGKKGKKADKKGKKDKESKKDKKSGKKDTKEGKKGKKGTNKNATENADFEEDYVAPAFDPYAIIDLPVLEDFNEEEIEEEEREDNDDEAEVTDNMEELPPGTLRQYKYNMYVIMYNYLDKAILRIVEMIELQPKENVSYAVIKEIEDQKYIKRLIDLKGLIMEEKSDKLKAKLILKNYRKRTKHDWKKIEIQRRLQNVKSDSSLWSVLRSDKTKLKLSESKPISYPMEHYDDLKRTSKDKLIKEGESEESKAEEPLMVNASTSTLDGRLDINWEDFKEIGIQKEYDENDEPDDFEAYIEKIVSELSVQDLIDTKLDKETQKSMTEHVSDEEYFYDTDNEISDFSAESEQSKDDSCSGLTHGVCAIPVEESCSCEGYGECNIPVEGLHTYEEFSTLFEEPFGDREG